MKPPRSGAWLHLRAQGLGWRWALICAVLALAAAALQWVALPAIDPAPVLDRPLESLGTVFSVVLAGLAGNTVHSRCPQLVATRARSLSLPRAVHVAVLFSACALTALVITSLGPPGLTFASVLRTYALVVGVHVVTSFRGNALAIVTTFALVGVLSAPGLVPWEVNLLYNTEAHRVAWTAVGILWGAVLALFLARANARPR